MDRIEFIQKLNLPLDNGREVHQNRLLQMVREGSRYSNQHLSGFHELKQHATLMTFLIHIYAFLTAQGIELLEKLMGRMFNRGKKKHKELFQKDGKAINEKVRLYAKVGKALIEVKELEQDPFESLQSIISWERFVQSVEQAEELARPAEFDYLELLDNHYGHFRQFAPRLLRMYVFKSSKASNHLRAGDMWVVGSKQYKDFEDYLLPQEKWYELKNKKTSSFNNPNKYRSVFTGTIPVNGGATF